MRKAIKAILLACILVLAALGCIACGEKTGTGEFVWQGLNDTVVASGDAFDPLAGVTVSCDGTDLTDKVDVLNADDDYEILENLGVIDDFDDFDHNSPGIYIVYYRVEYNGESDIQARKVTVQQKHNLSNADFANANNTAFNYWTINTPGGIASVEKFNDNGKIVPKLTLSDAGNNWYSLQYINNTPNVEQGQAYKITIRAKSSTGKSVAFGFEDMSNNYRMLKNLTVHRLTSEYQEYESYFEPQENYNGVKAVLYFGRMLPTDRGNHEIILDYIKIEKVDVCPQIIFGGVERKNFTTTPTSFDSLTEFKADPLAGVTVMKNDEPVDEKYISVIGEIPDYVTENAVHDIVYKVSVPNSPIAFATRQIGVQVGNDNPSDVMNGNFAQGYDYWTKDMNAGSGSKATYEIVTVGEGSAQHNEAQITIVNPASEDWHIQLNQMVARLEANTTYNITVVAKAKNAFTANFEMRASQKFPLAFDGGEEYQTFTFEYLSTSTGNAKAAFLLGGGGSRGNADNVYTIRSVSIVKAGTVSGEAYEMFNPDFANGLTAWTREVSVGTASFAAATDEDNLPCTTVTLTSNAYDADWNVQLRQDGKKFQSGKTYKITFVAKADVSDRAVQLEVVRLGSTNATLWSKRIELSSTIETYELEFTPDSDLTDIRVGVLLGQSGMQGSVVTIYQFSIELVS